MAISKRLRDGLAALVLLSALGAGVMFVSSDPTPRAGAQTTQLAGAEAPAGLRGRSGPLAERLRVIDGDTFEDLRADVTYRIVNIDTPETGSRAACVAERELGNRATEAARRLVSQAQRLELRPTGRIDRYGRTIAFALLDGADWGETLIAAGLARPWRGRREPWCDANGALIP